jgi:hypothetical protein
MGGAWAWLAAAWARLVLLWMALGMTGFGCGAQGPEAPDRASPLSTAAEEAPLPEIAQALVADPLSAGMTPSPAGDEPSPHVHKHPPQTSPAANLPEETKQTEHPATFVCPMHADVVTMAPGKCPRCGMALIPTPHQAQAIPEPALPNAPNTHHAH